MSDRTRARALSFFAPVFDSPQCGLRPNIDRPLHRNSKVITHQCLLPREIVGVEKRCARLPQNSRAAFKQFRHSARMFRLAPRPQLEPRQRSPACGSRSMHVTQSNFGATRRCLSPSAACNSGERLRQRAVRLQIQQRAMQRFVRRGTRSQANAKEGIAHILAAQRRNSRCSQIAARYFHRVSLRFHSKWRHSVPAISRSMSAAVSKNC